MRSTKREKKLGTVILFVTSRCNSLCQTCFYHEELNRPGDMTFDQIEKVSHTMPAITDLWLSGGEPTLRHDASEIIDLFVRNNGVERLIIPTNGLVKSRVYEIVDRALSTHNELDLYLNIALDGQGATHDLIRVSEQKATEYDAAEQWLKSLRVYSDLSSLEPANPEWKDKLKLATRRIRLLALYTPEQMKQWEFKRNAINRYFASLGYEKINVNQKPYCEPQLSKYGLARFRSGLSSTAHHHALLWVLNYSDGENTLLDIAARAGLHWSDIKHAAIALRACDLLKLAGPAVMRRR